METPLLPEPKYQCPLCEKEFPIDRIFLAQDPGSGPKPIACTRCIEGLYWSIPTKSLDLVKR